MNKTQKKVYYFYACGENSIAEELKETLDLGTFSSGEKQAIKDANEYLEDDGDADYLRIVKITVEAEEKTRPVVRKTNNKNNKIEWGFDD